MMKRTRPRARCADFAAMASPAGELPPLREGGGATARSAVGGDRPATGVVEGREGRFRRHRFRPQCAGMRVCAQRCRRLTAKMMERRHQHYRRRSRWRRRSGIPDSRITINSGAISDTLGRLPAMKITEPYSPTARANASANPVSSAGIRLGRMTRNTVCQRLAPRRWRRLPRSRDRDRSAPAAPSAPRRGCR